MASRLLTQLAARIAAARDPVEAACLRAQRGIYLARQGKVDAAQAIVKAIRDEFGTRPNAEVMAWVSLVEALVHFYSQPGPNAMDRLRRAHALGRAMQHPVLVPLSAAWLAHIEFNANQLEPMLQHVQETLQLAQPDHHAALARVSLVVADAFHYAGRFDLAKDWYAAVRQHALAEGDDAMISAMLHNVAALRTNQVRVADAFKQPQPADAKQALMELESTKNYDLGIGTISLASFLPLVRAQLLTVEGRYVEALQLFSEVLDQRRSDNLERREACFFADRAWCNLQIGRRELALADVESACDREGVQADLDDAATTHARIAEVLDQLGDADKALTHRRIAAELRFKHAVEQESLLSRLQETLAGRRPVF